MIHLSPGFCKEITDVRYQQGICMIGSCLCYIDFKDSTDNCSEILSHWNLWWLQVLWVILYFFHT